MLLLGYYHYCFTSTPHFVLNPVVQDQSPVCFSFFSTEIIIFKCLRNVFFFSSCVHLAQILMHLRDREMLQHALAQMF